MRLIYGMKQFIHNTIEYIGELLRVILISMAIILPVRYFLIQPFYVKGASMEPNFYDHEYLIIDEISYRFKEPARGDIVVFRYPSDPRQFFIKRVLGLPGETIQVKDGGVYLVDPKDGKLTLLSESYLDGVATPGERQLQLGLDEYFVLGDNRPSSMDSRHFGAVSRSLIVGRVWLRGWPLDRVGKFVTPVYSFN